MGDVVPDRDRLDPLCIEMLMAVDKQGGTATTREIRKLIGEDSTTRTNYRISEYLEPMGLVDVERPDDDEFATPPKILHLTEQGEEILETVDDSEHEFAKDIGEQMKVMENKIEAIEDRIMTLETSHSSQDSDVDSGGAPQESIAEVASELEKIKSEVEDIKSSLYFTDQIKGEIDTAILCSVASREILKEEFGESRFTEEIEKQKKREDVELLYLE